jgi:phage shock protein C
MTKKLYRSRTNSMIAGVCGGLAEYFDIDASLVRVGAVLFTLAWGSGLLAYVILWLIVAQKPLESSVMESEGGQKETVKADESDELERDKGVLFVGIILTVLGVLLLMNNYLSFAWLSFRRLWPLLIIFVGLMIIMKGSGSKGDES